MAYKISGTIISLGSVQNLASKAGNSYQKRDVVITIRKFDPYTGVPTEDSGNTPKFTFIGDKVSQTAALKPGDIVVIHFDISGRKFQRDSASPVEYFTELRPFRIELTSQPSKPAFTALTEQPGIPDTLPSPEPQDQPRVDTDDLPF